MCKGADSIILQLLDPENSSELVNTTKEHITVKKKYSVFIFECKFQKFAQEGLRTLCFSYKIIEPESYKSIFFIKKFFLQIWIIDWAEKYEEAKRSIFQREKKMEKLCKKMENNLFLLGVSSIFNWNFLKIFRPLGLKINCRKEFRAQLKS